MNPVQHVNVVDNAPKQIFQLLKEISGKVNMWAKDPMVFVVGLITVVVKPREEGGAFTHIYEFGKTCYPVAQLRDDGKERVIVYEVDSSVVPYCIDMETILEALKAVPDMLQARLPSL